MVKNQLPEGVGKKIVEALKRQAETDITPSKTLEKEQSDIAIDDQEIANIDFDSLSDNVINPTNDNFIIEDSDNNSSESETFNIDSMLQEPTALSYNNTVPVETNKTSFVNEPSSESFTMKKEDTVLNQTLNEPVPETPIFKINEDAASMVMSAKALSNTTQTFSVNTPLSEEPKKQTAHAVAPIKIPTNVAVLKNLIASLPVGVTKQTGAQIIRQTLEAMGLPMAGVLREAQEVQETLNTNTRECMLKIQEYKTNIMMLEQSVQEYQKNVTQINDLVSLFLLTDRK